MATPEEVEAAKQLIESNFERFEQSNYYEILEISRDAREADIKKAYFKLAKKYHPDSFAGMDLGESGAKADAIFAKITDAYDTLLVAEKREHYDAVLDGKVMEDDAAIEQANIAIHSEMEFQKGEILLKMSKYAEAEPYFRRAVKLKPDEGDYWAYLGWVTYKMRKGDLQLNQKKGKNYLKKALEVKPECDRAYTFMGYIAKLENKPAIAYDLFRKALSLNPKNREASREAKAFEAAAARVLKNQEAEKAEEKKGGILGVFKRGK